MLRIIRQFFAARQTTPQPVKTLPQTNTTHETTLVYVRVKPETKSAAAARIEDDRLVAPCPAPTLPSQSASPPVGQQKPQRRQARKAGSQVSLASIGIFSAGQIKLLRQIGCRTDRHLQRLTPRRLEKRLADYLAAQQNCPNARLAPPTQRIRTLVRRGRWAIRFASHFDDMTPQESLLLRAVHRGNRQNLARDSAGMIRRDLQRLALSSRGKRIVNLDQIPDLQRLNRWITAAREARTSKPRDASSRGDLGRGLPSLDSQTDVPMVPR